MLYTLILLLQMTLVDTYELSDMQFNFNSFEMISEKELLLYDKNVSEIFKVSLKSHEQRRIQFKKSINSESFNITLLPDNSFIVKTINGISFKRFNYLLEFIREYTFVDSRDYQYFNSSPSNKLVLFNPYEDSFIIFDLINNKVLSKITKTEQKYFNAEDITGMITTKSNILLFSYHSILYFDHIGRFISQVKYDKTVINLINIGSNNFILFDDKILELNGKEILTNVSDIKLFQNHLYVLVNKRLYKYDL